MWEGHTAPWERTLMWDMHKHTHTHLGHSLEMAHIRVGRVLFAVELSVIWETDSIFI